MSEIRAIKRALLSVSDKTGLIDFARALSERGVALISTGGTHKAIAQAGINAFLTKPASLEDLLATLAAWSTKTPSEDRITPAAPEAAPDTDPAPRP